ncbi:Talin-2 [Liparis tanakae]|uniref:Talin-2 n=1 Tax=Liparis tanakae TaxID=230148 RepID=A0A4Z2GU35_9TELE|nr:Talin-2 [Liparis tanakae]
MGEGETDEKFQAKNVAQVAEDTVLQNRVIAAATQCALSTSQLVACTKVLVLKRVHLCSHVDEGDTKRSEKLSFFFFLFYTVCHCFMLYCLKLCVMCYCCCVGQETLVKEIL